jgi:hypothetical protein
MRLMVLGRSQGRIVGQEEIAERHRQGDAVFLESSGKS